MPMEKFSPEILSPVGNEEMLCAAVRAGADAVYLGAKDFNARRNADNFGFNQLKDAIDYCHIRGVKVYLTLNILISDGETEKALGLAEEVYNLGIDGVIIADLGLARLLKEHLPLLPLHASTQMTVCHKDSLPLLKEMGFCRVVAAREMSKSELTELCSEAKRLNMEVEVFVHGALCMCLSGQCLLSALLGGRSGNRGLCAGPCRLPFKDGQGNDYVLSLKDLSLLEHFGELAEMGVASLKIEGRMKRYEYVAAATAAFRSMADNAEVNEEIKQCLGDVFSRSGFTDGYFTDNTGKEMFGIRTKEDVTDAKDSYPYLHQLIRRERSSVPVSVFAEIIEGRPVKLTLSDGENSVTVTGDIPEKAVSKPLTKEIAQTQLTKLGSTPYYAEKTEIVLIDKITVRTSSLNELRRTACEKLDGKRCEVKREKVSVNFTPEKAENIKEDPLLWLRLKDLSLLPKDLSKISAVLLPIEADHDLSLLNKGITAVAELPRAGLFGEKLKKRLNKAVETGFTAALVQNLGQLNAVKNAELTPIAGNGLNIFSSYALKTVKTLGADTAVLSTELTKEQINSLVPLTERVLFAYGRLPLMITKNCPCSFGGCKDCKGDRFITDRKGVSFPVKCRSGFSELFGDRPVWLADRLTEFNANALLLYFTFEDREEIESVVNAYKNGGKPRGEFTRGMYYRGVE